MNQDLVGNLTTYGFAKAIIFGEVVLTASLSMPMQSDPEDVEPSTETPASATREKVAVDPQEVGRFYAPKDLEEELPSTDQLLRLAEHSPPPPEWFEAEMDKPF